MPQGTPKNGVNKGWIVKGTTAWNKSNNYKNCLVCDVLFHSASSQNQKTCSNKCKYIYIFNGKPAWNKGTKGICKANSGSFRKGHHHSELWKKKQNDSWKIGERVSGSLGKHWKLSEETKKKISLARLGKPNLHIRGEKCHLWKEGVSKFNRTIRENIMSTLEYKLWTRDVKKRDDYRCLDCGERGGILNADHIYQFSKYPRLRFDINNGQTLCANCHMRKTIFERTGVYTVQ